MFIYILCVCFVFILRNDNKPIETDIKTNEPKQKLSKNHNLTNSDSETPIEKLPNTDLNRTYLPKHLTVHALREVGGDNATDNDPSSTDDQYNSLSSAQATESEPRSQFILLYILFCFNLHGI
jgi:hypothetical protein